MFKISNNGFIGSSYLEIQLGNSEELLKNNDHSVNNIDAVSFEEIINNFILISILSNQILATEINNTKLLILDKSSSSKYELNFQKIINSEIYFLK